MEFVRLTEKNKKYPTLKLNRLREYEDLLESGQAKILPCKVGDKIYVVPSDANFGLNYISPSRKGNNRIYEPIVESIHFYPSGYLLKCCDGLMDVIEQFFGETWFLSKQEAKNKLNELQEKWDKVYNKKVDDSFDCGYHEYAKEKHDARVTDTPNRIEFAKRQFESNNIEFILKNKVTGHFHCFRKSDNKLFQFYAGTGKIVGESERGIHALIKILTK